MDIFKAISEGNLDRAKELIQEPGFNVNQSNDKGYSPINYASVFTKYDILDELLKVPGIDINIPAPDSWTVLLGAVSLNELDLVKKILQVPGIDINYADNEGNTALLTATKGKVRTIQTEIVRELLQVPGINVNHADNRGNTALMIACFSENESIIHLLLQVPGINVNHVNNMRDTALVIACDKGNIPIVYLLLQVPGIDINKGHPIFNLVIRALLGWSNISKIETIIHEMLEMPGLDINCGRNKYDNIKETLLSITINRKELLNIRNDLIAHGADLNMPLIFSIHSGNLADVQELISLGADVTTTYNGETALTISRNRHQGKIANEIERAIEKRREIVIYIYGEKTGMGGSQIQILLEYLGISAPANVMLGGYYRKLEKYQYKLKI